MLFRSSFQRHLASTISCELFNASSAVLSYLIIGAVMSGAKLAESLAPIAWKQEKTMANILGFQTQRRKTFLNLIDYAGGGCAKGNKGGDLCWVRWC